MRLTFGKYKGSEVADLPQSYLEWLAENHSDLIVLKECRDEILRRQGQSVQIKLPEQEFMNRLATLLLVMPDKLMNIEFWVKTPECKFLFFARRESK